MNPNPRLALLHSHSDDLLRALADPTTADDAFTSYLRWASVLHRYSWNNAVAIGINWTQRQHLNPNLPPLSHVASYRTWQSLARQVRKGEHGIPILCPVPRYHKLTSTDPEAESVTQLDGIRFRLGHCFDVSQTDGPPIPSWLPDLPDSTALLPHLVSAAAALGVRVQFQPGGTEGGSSQGGLVTINTRLPAGSHAQILAHELGHETLRHAALRRAGTAPPPALTESEAEAVACIVMRACGFQITPNSAAYCRSHGGNPDLLRPSLLCIHSAAAAILAAAFPPAAPPAPAAATT